MLFLSVRRTKTKIMFRKLVSNLPFSPALVGQLGFYARRLRREEATRRLGLIFTALALVVQSFAVFSPPEPANAANASDFIYGGISTKSQLLAAYDNSARGNGDIKQIFDYAGITRAELAATSEGSLNSVSRGKGDSAWLSWGRAHRFSAAQGEVKHNANGVTVYSRPLWLFDSTSYTKKNGSTYRAFVGNSAKMGQFAILKDCANLVTTKTPTPPPPPPPPAPSPEASCIALQLKRIDRTRYNLSASSQVKNGAKVSSYAFVIKKGATVVDTQTITTSALSANSKVFDLKEPTQYGASVVVATSLGNRTSTACTGVINVSPPEKCIYNPDLTVEDRECQPCPDNPDLWYKSEDCAPKVASGKEATNLTQGNTQAETVTANASDRIEYRVSIYNVGKVPATTEFKEELADVLEYATIQDNGGGTFDDAAKTLSWGDIKLQPGEKITRSFVVTLKAEIPATPQGTSDSTSYDCVMTNAFGDTINIDVNCAPPKIVEEIIGELPSTGPGENLLFAGVVGSAVTYFWARSRQMNKEVRLIRKDFNAGTL